MIDIYDVMIRENVFILMCFKRFFYCRHAGPLKASLNEKSDESEFDAE